jgi:hypothetical protein
MIAAKAKEVVDPVVGGKESVVPARLPTGAADADLMSVFSAA